jgi:hypothetical protein
MDAHTVVVIIAVVAVLAAFYWLVRTGTGKSAVGVAFSVGALACSL